MVLMFSDVLRAGGLDPTGVRLLRHCAPRIQQLIYRAAIDGDPRFDRYQAAQTAPQVIEAFRRCTHVAGFVVDARGDCVFAGVWAIAGESAAAFEPPFPGMLAIEREVTVFETSRVPAFDGYRGRLVVEWGPGARAWTQRADRQEKPVIELRRQVVEPVFPGYLGFRWGLGEVESLPSTWIAALRAVGGVYLLTHRPSGELYVGSATGADGFVGRWLCYQNGHGGNVGMRELQGDAVDYEVSILETVGSGADEHSVLALESVWKQKLGTRARGLNRN